MRTANLGSKKSAFGPDETMKRFITAIEARGMTVYARIDHAAAAAQAGLTLQPTAVLIFGDPHQGTPLMQVTRTVALDLPVRGLVWQDQHGTTWLSYNDPSWLLQRHGIDPSADPAVAMATGLIACVQEAVGDAEGQDR